MENTQKSFIRQPGRKAEDSIRKMTIYKDSAVNAMKDSLEFDKKIVESNDEYIKKLREADATEYDILKATAAGMYMKLKLEKYFYILI